MLGDSIIESLTGNKVQVGSRECAIVNGGFANIGVRDLAEQLDAIVPSLAPRFVLLSVGINDARTGLDTTAWAASYARLVAKLIASDAVPALFTVVPPEAGQLLSGYFSASAVAEMNAAIRRIASEHNLPLIDLASVLAGPDGMAMPGTTIDGIHPTPATLRTYEEIWFPLAVEQLQQRTGTDCAPAHRSAPLH